MEGRSDLVLLSIWAKNWRVLYIRQGQSNQQHQGHYQNEPGAANQYPHHI